MRRREFIALAGAAYPVAVLAQRPETVRRVGILMPYPDGDGEVQARVATFREELRKLGWSQGENLRIYERWATDSLDRLRSDAADLVNLRVDIVFTTGGRVLRAIQQQTGSVPIVFAAVTDPLGQGLVASLARPGGNITGISSPEFSVAAKLPEILKQLAPSVIRAAFVNNPENPSAAFIAREFTATARALGLEPVFIPMRQPADMDRAFEAFAREPHGGLVFPSDLTVLQHRELVVGSAARHRLPAVYSDRAMVTSGGLASYSADRIEMFRRAALHVNRILRGEKAGDLPVEEPTKFELVINVKTAVALGLDVSSTLLARADEVIE